MLDVTLWSLAVILGSTRATPPAPLPPSLARADSIRPSLDDTATLAPFLDGVMAAHLERLKIPAAVVVIVDADRVLFARGYGNANLERRTPIDPATSMFHIGSTGKLFTWTAIMQLAERGKVDLDADVNRYLGDFRIPATFPEPITLRHLLTHTAGFEDGVLGYFITLDTTHISSISDVVSRHVPTRLRPAGTLGSYSNYGAALAGLIVERVSGLPFAEYIERNIYGPLGIRYATFREPLPRALEPFAVTGYAREGGAYVARPYEINGGWTPAGGTSISGLDIARFMIAHLRDGEYAGTRILRPETARQMHTATFRHDPRLPGVALGFYESRINGWRVIGHGGDSFWFHTDLHLIPDRKVGIFMSYVGDGGNEAREALTHAFFDRYFPASLPPAAISPATRSADLSRYAGEYRFVRMNYTELDKVVWLFQPPIRVVARPTGTLQVSGPLDRGGSEFVPIDPHLFQEVGGYRQIAFREEGGRITRVFFDAAPYQATERIPWYERASLWYAVLGIAFPLLLSAIIDPACRRAPLRGMASGQRWAVLLAAATAAWLMLTVAALGTVVVTYGMTLLGRIPSALVVALAMPVGFAVLTLGLIGATARAWRRGYWSRGRRVHFTLVTLASLAVSLFFWQWNILGWQLG